MFFTFRQINSGGSYVRSSEVDVCVIIEAASSTEANERAQAVGIYFNGVDKERDCSCCGDRWYRMLDTTDGAAQPSISGTPFDTSNTTQDFEEWKRFRKENHCDGVVIHYDDGLVLYGKAPGYGKGDS